ncbi:hypothetical protein [Pseudomonas sp. C2B4]|uniref:hypothetical protein n=1 Tax=Pseudomonas sp. C2B4 TaxID=2735270 RepID=UPI0015862D54|nr:hypothetical protein [Pseudomonas sp. C2B4]NUU38176.1 hypothetical protein [Pseudomonas sp. C2B4]
MFINVLEAKEFCNNRTNSRLSEEEALDKIRQLETYINDAPSEHSKLLFQEWIDEIRDWIDSDERKKGEFPQGIDQIILDIIEVRAFIHALQKTPSAQNRLGNSFFWQQWLIGSAHTIIVGIGKLVSTDPRDNSLANLWKEVGIWIKGDGACDIDEATFIEQAFRRKTGYFDNKNSKTFNYRNKSIAHNEHSPEITWDDLDPDMRILVRSWSLLVAWSSFGILNPFRTNKEAFGGLESFFSAEEITKLGSERNSYLDMVKGWSTTYLHTKASDPGRGAFSKGVKISISHLD